jgi:hypothetical protein
MLELLEQWTQGGSSRLDRDLDGVIDAGPAPAIWDELYPRLVDAVLGGVMGPQLDELKTLIGRNNNPASGFTNGGINYLDKDLAAIAGARFRSPLRTRFCGGGDAAACRDLLWRTLDEAGAAIARRQGNENPDQWSADARPERISFVPGLLQTTIRYTNRPSGIQQVVSFGGHRPRRR